MNYFKRSDGWKNGKYNGLVGILFFSVHFAQCWIAIEEKSGAQKNLTGKWEKWHGDC